MSKTRRTTFKQAIRQTLEILKTESPITVSTISDLSGTDPRTVARVLEFLIGSQENFTKTVIHMLEGKWGKVIWRKDRIDKMKMPKDVREWYIQKRFFDDECQIDIELEQMQEMFVDEKRTAIEEVVRRIFMSLEIEDDITIAELARRTKVNRKTIDRALNLILEFQDEIALGFVVKKELVIWRQRPSLDELDETTLKVLLQLWYCPNDLEDLPDDKERELLLLA
ncbi:MAG: hypothetical protein ACW98Y_16740 [Candidatus Thorarchaeota archaeon]